MAQFGMWGFGTTLGNAILPTMGAFLKGMFFAFKWNEIEPSPGVFNFTSMNTEFKKASDAGLDIGFMIWTGEFVTDWLYQAPYSVPKLKVHNEFSASEFGQGTKYFPYYFNTTYQSRFNQMLLAAEDNILTLDETVRAHIKYVQSAEGTTGDPGPWHGIIQEVTINGVVQANPEAYNIEENGPEWDAFKKQIWTNMSAHLPDGIELMINPTNEGVYFQYAIDTLPDAFLKYGDYSHNFAFFGNSYYADYIRLRYTPFRITRAELNIENVFIKWNSLNAGPQGLFAMIAQALDARVTTLNLPLSVYQYLKTPNNLSYDFYNEYALLTTPSDPLRKGFAYLRRQPNLCDTDVYSEAVYGPLIDPSNNGTIQRSYDGALRIINADTTTNYWQKQFKISNQRMTKINPRRVDLIRAAFAKYGFQYDPINNRDEDHWSFDFGIDNIEGNYYRYVRQINPYNTSEPAVRVGNPAADQLGAFGLYTTQEMYFDCTSEGLTTTGNNNVTVTVYYYDGAVGTVRLFYFDGRRKKVLGTITTGNSRQYLPIIFVARDFKGGGNLTAGSDFFIKKISGQNVIISLIKIDAFSAPPPTDDPKEDEPRKHCININLNIDKLILNFGGG